MSLPLQNLLRNRRQKGQPGGIYSVCSAHPWVLRASVQRALADQSLLLIEATSNQVNQEGGYTGMRPADFHRLVHEIAKEEGFEKSRLVLGGDHLGPNPWQKLPSKEAMERAKAMIAEYAEAGFTKLHLDASMSCADDDTPLSDEVVAERAARLCAAAEESAKGSHLVYIVGTEVPVPGGATESLSHLEVTSPERAQRTLEIHHDVFCAHGLESVWPRVVGLVVQPGVEFNHDSVVEYLPEKAAGLATVLDRQQGLVFEAHSTDYQRPESYVNLIRDGFAILKVGPALTFVMREALFALSAIESEIVSAEQASRLPEVMDAVMVKDPANWKSHYHGTPAEVAILRRYSYSDRLRYYWPNAEVQQAVGKLMANLARTPIPETLLSAHLKDQYRAVREGTLKPEAEAIVLHSVRQALAPYATACLPS